MEHVADAGAVLTADLAGNKLLCVLSVFGGTDLHHQQPPCCQLRQALAESAPPITNK